MSQKKERVMGKMFEEVEVGNLKLKNRVMRGATWENLATDDGKLTDELYKVYEELAEGDVGLITTGYAFIMNDEQPNPGMMCAANDEAISTYSKLTEMVHAKGSKIMMQLAYGGSQTGFNVEGRTIWSPSGIEDLAFGVTPTPMTKDDIQQLIKAFGDAAVRAKNVGFDGVQLHAAHGYLLSQFLTPYYNRRDDEYGGSIENRARIIIEAFKEVRQRVGDDYMVSVRFNSQDFFDNGLTFDDAQCVAKMLDECGADLIELSGGSFASGENNPCRKTDKFPDTEAYHAEFAAKVAQDVKAPVAVIGGFRTPETIDRVLDTTGVKLVAMSRPFLQEPGILNRWESGDLAPSECFGCNGCFKDRPAGYNPCVKRRHHVLEDK